MTYNRSINKAPLLRHYSDRVIQTWDPCWSKPDTEHKPGGLWLSDDSQYGWIHYLTDRLAERHPDWSDAPERWRYVHEVRVDLGSILVVADEAGMRDFVRRFRESEHRECLDESGNRGFGLHIDWNRVKSAYKGVLFTPHQEEFSHREGGLAFHWNKIDCASAWVCDASCVLEWTPLPANPWHSN